MTAAAGQEDHSSTADLLSTVVEYSVVSKQDDNVPRAKRETLAEFSSRFRTPRVSLEKDGLGIIPARFSRPQRITENVLYNTFIGLDFDNGRHTVEEIKHRLAHYAHILHTSYSHLHDGKGPRYRVFVFFAQPIPKERLSDVFAYFNLLFDGELDSRCKVMAKIAQLEGQIEASERRLEDLRVAVPATADLDRLKASLRSRLAQFQDLIRADVPKARQALRKLLKAPLAFEPLLDGGYSIRGEMQVGALLAQVGAPKTKTDPCESVYVGLASPRGLVRVISGVRVPGEAWLHAV